MVQPTAAPAHAIPPHAIPPHAIPPHAVSPHAVSPFARSRVEPPGARRSDSGAVIRLHALLPRSRANGPGLRTVVWTQGCTLACPGCFNPDTHTAGGTPRAVAELADEIGSLGVEGVTVSGGEPLEQAEAVLELARRCRSRGLSVLVLTGFTLPELRRRRPEVAAGLARHADVVVAGRYVAARRLASGLRGSANKTIHLMSDRYRPADLEAVPPAEVMIAPDGTVTLTGVDPLTEPVGSQPPDQPTPGA